MTRRYTVRCVVSFTHFTYCQQPPPPPPPSSSTLFYVYYYTPAEGFIIIIWDSRETCSPAEAVCIMYTVYNIISWRRVFVKVRTAAERVIYGTYATCKILLDRVTSGKF